MDNLFDLPPLPDPMDYCYEWDGPWGTRRFSPNQYNGRKSDRSVAIFTADQMRAYANAAVEAERVKLLKAFKLEHLYQGGCPDEFSDPRRDPNCPACRALVALGIGEFT